MKRNTDVFSEFIVGVFMVAVLALLAYFTIVISGVDLLVGRSRVHAKVEFSDVGGLKNRDNVMYRGMKVGSVERIDLAPSNILVTVSVDRDVVLREGCRVSVEPLSLLGGNYLLLEEGEGKARPLETTLFRGEPPVNFLRDAGRLIGKLEKAGDGLSSIIPEGVRTNLEQTIAGLNRIVARIEKGEGTIGRLVADDGAVVSELKSGLEGFRKTFDSASSVAARVERGEGTVGRLLSSDDTVYADLKKTLANAAEVSDRLAAGQGVLGELMATNGTMYADVRAAVANVRAVTERLQSKDGLLARISGDRELADNAAALVRNLKTVSERLEKGEGTLGKLAAESELYDELNALLKDVRQIVDNYRDTTPITTFGSLATGAL